MSAFYGLVEGNRSCATRGGSKSSGFLASAQSWDGSIIVRLYYDNDQLKCRVGTNEGSACYTDYNSADFVGSFEEFKKLLNLNKLIKNGQARVIKHRVKK